LPRGNRCSPQEFGPPEPVVTGNREADSLDTEPHDMESYDDLF